MKYREIFENVILDEQRVPYKSDKEYEIQIKSKSGKDYVTFSGDTLSDLIDDMDRTSRMWLSGRDYSIVSFRGVDKKKATKFVNDFIKDNEEWEDQEIKRSERR